MMRKIASSWNLEKFIWREVVCFKYFCWIKLAVVLKSDYQCKIGLMISIPCVIEFCSINSRFIKNQSSRFEQFPMNWYYFQSAKALQIYVILLDSESGPLKKPSAEKLVSKENAPQMVVNTIFKQSVSIMKTRGGNCNKSLYICKNFIFAYFARLPQYSNLVSSLFFFLQMQKKGSFLGRNKETLARIAELTKTSVNPTGPRNSRNFVFQVITQDKDTNTQVCCTSYLSEQRHKYRFVVQVIYYDKDTNCLVCYLASDVKNPCNMLRCYRLRDRSYVFIHIL